MWASDKGHFDVVGFLLEQGAEPDIQSVRRLNTFYAINLLYIHISIC